MESEDETSIYILQVLMSDLRINQSVVEHQKQKQADFLPALRIKIQDGPEVYFPYPFSKTPTLDHNHNETIFTFERGKSCLFGQRFGPNQNSIKLTVKLENVVSFPPSEIGSLQIEKLFDPNSLSIHNFLNGNLRLFDTRNEPIGTVGLLSTLQAIGTLPNSNSFRRLPQLPKSEGIKNPNSKSLFYDSGTNKNMLIPVESADSKITEPPVIARQVRTPDGEPLIIRAGDIRGMKPMVIKRTASKRGEDSRSSRTQSDEEYSDDFCSSESSRTSTTSKDGSSASRRKKLKSAKRISANERPKGWLRSSPVYKGNILDIPPPSPSTRSTYFKFLTTYPTLKSQVQNEIDKQLKEKVKLIDQEYKNWLQEQKQKMEARNRLRPPSTKRKPTLHKETQSETDGCSLMKSDKATEVGQSLMEEDFLYLNDPEADSELLLLSDISRPSLPDDSPDSACSINSKNVKDSKIESSHGEPSSEFHYFSLPSELLMAREEPQSSNSIQEKLPDSEKKELQHPTTTDNTKKVVNRKKGDVDVQTSKKSLKQMRNEDMPGNEHFERRQKILQYKKSKTTSSVYPETSEDPEYKTIPSPRVEGINHMEISDISDISARLAAILVPEEGSSPNTGSCQPSDITESLSSLTSL